MTMGHVEAEIFAKENSHFSHITQNAKIKFQIDEYPTIVTSFLCLFYLENYTMGFPNILRVY